MLLVLVPALAIDQSRMICFLFLFPGYIDTMFYVVLDA